MKVTLYNAISVDGYLARRDGDTNWVADADWKVFSNLVKENGCIVMGRKTMDTSGDDFPYDCDLNIVMTRGKNLVKEGEKIIITNKLPREVVELAKSKGFDKLLIIGGGEVNMSFIKEGLVDEVIVSVHPNIFGDGIRLFEGGEVDINLKFLGMKQVGEELVQIRYMVRKK